MFSLREKYKFIQSQILHQGCKQLLSEKRVSEGIYGFHLCLWFEDIINIHHPPH